MEIEVTELKQLRKRLGWSIHDLARRFDCLPDDVTAWENGDTDLTKEQYNHFIHLREKINFESDKLKRQPVLEKILKESGLAQIPDDGVNFINVEGESSD